MAGAAPARLRGGVAVKGMAPAESLSGGEGGTEEL